MRIVFIGAVRFSGAMLESLIHASANVVGVCTFKGTSGNADQLDLSPIAYGAKIPVHHTTDINDRATEDWIRSLAPDIIFCFGWSRLIKRNILIIPKSGVIGYHPAALPANRGRHPIIWALVLGLRETASSFFYIDEGADSGDLVSQRLVPIYKTDYSEDLYTRIINIASVQLVELLGDFAANTVQRTPQSHVLATYWRKRGRVDGQIDWRMSGQAIYNLIRALSPPYPCAHFSYRGRDVRVWRAQLGCEVSLNIEPGKVISVADTELLVKTGDGSILLLGYDPVPEIIEGEYL